MRQTRISNKYLFRIFIFIDLSYRISYRIPCTHPEPRLPLARLGHPYIPCALECSHSYKPARNTYEHGQKLGWLWVIPLVDATGRSTNLATPAPHGRAIYSRSTAFLNRLKPIILADVRSAMLHLLHVNMRSDVSEGIELTQYESTPAITSGAGSSTLSGPNGRDLKPTFTGVLCL